MRIFIDTEFTDFIDCHLISIAMVSEYGEEFYYEVPFPDASCSPFVREVVIPLLNHDSRSSCSRDELKSHILNWLKLVRSSAETEILISYDYSTDFDLFVDALDRDLPKFVVGELIDRGISDQLLFEFWRNNPELSEHHALHDARANAYAFRESMLECPK
jgi:hypothetical protein